jgi:DNA-binding response OmpR family regulator
MILGQKRILYVEDQEDMCFLMTVLFEYHGFEAVTVKTGTEALNLARSERFDLFLLDSRLPDMTGIELCREIRASDHLTPVIFFSGMERSADKQEALGAGAQGYVVKPAEPDTIMHAVREALAEGVPSRRQPQAS